MKFFICDDLSLDRDILKKYISTFCNRNNIEYVFQEFESAEELIKNIDYTNCNHSIIFLDIYMNNLSGMEAAKILFKNSFEGSIIFTTHSKDFAIESYQVNADGYLHKPYTYNDFEHAMKRSQLKLKTALKYIELTSNRLNYKILLKDIIYIESANHCTYLHLLNQVIKSRQPITEINSTLKNEENFLKISRSFIINLNMLDHMDNDYLYMKDNSSILLPVRQKVKIRGTIADYFWNVSREK